MSIRPNPTRARSALVAASLLVTCASPALGFAPGEATPARETAIEAPRAPAVERVLRGAAGGDAERSKTVMQRISERLRRLPLRPVMIGEAPRTPDDPEPGAGVTIFIRF